MAEKLVWLPTWHQARMLSRRLGIGDDDASSHWRPGASSEPADDLRRLYRLINATLKNKSHRR
jgi:hypothetical protein